MDDDISTGLRTLERILNGERSPGKLKLSVLRHVTANFSEERKIGEGGCGHVYKGLLPSGQTVAVKKLLNAKTMDDRMFQQEVTAMMSVKHKNIVRFLGYCSHIEERAIKIHGRYILVEERERLLCFDYISKGSLADHVTDELRGLRWHTRFQIIKGICEGLYHLHMEKGIIHMDLKPPNILLDDDLVPKITDFGISRNGDISKTISQERLFSLGYCAPEYQLNGKMSFKSDIYSLGVMIKEMVTGSREEPNIATVHRRWRHRWKKSAKHTPLLGYEQQVTKCLELAQRCQNWNPTERPNIHGIKEEMDNIGRHISDATNSTVEQKNSFWEDMLGIEPLELHFTAELKKKISHPVQLINATNDYVAIRISLGEKNIAFGVPRTTSQRLPLRMLPSKDIIPPRSSSSVTITLEALKKPLQEEQCKTELCVQSTRVEKGLTTNDITSDMFMEEQDKVVDVVNLTVSVRAPKHVLIVKPLELCYWPIEPKKLLPFSVQLTNKTDDFVAFMFTLPQGKVLYYQAMGMGIMPPWSTRGVVIYMFVEEEALADMQCKDTFIVRSVIIDEGYFCDNVNMDWFNEQTGVHQVELDIMFAEPSQHPQAPSSVRHPIYDVEQDSEDGELELTGDWAALTSPLSIETELLHIYPAELRFTSKEVAEYISLINKTDNDVIYVIAGECGIRNGGYKGVVPPQCTSAILVFSEENPSGVMGGMIRIMMISESHCHCDTDLDNYFNYYYKREELMNKVRAEGGKAHEALLECVLHAPRLESVATKQHEVIRMDENGLGYANSMDVHPMEPWIVTGHRGGGVCIWKMDPKTSACEMISSPNRKESSISSVKFIARMQWVASGDYNGYISVYTYVVDDRLIEFMRFRAEECRVHALVLAVHPTLPYLLSSSKCNLIKLWNWDQHWMCTREFSNSSSIDIFSTRGMAFNPMDANSFASLDNDGEINIWSIDSEGPTTCLQGDTVGIAYCNAGGNLQCMATIDWEGEIEVLALQSNTTTHVHTLEVMGLRKTTFDMCTWFIACHPTRPLLATAKADTGVFLWNCTTYGLKKVFRLDCDYYSESMCLGFIDIEGFQRLVIAYSDEIKLVDIFDGPTLPVLHGGS